MNLENLKFLVVGAGFYGSVFAERIASELNEKVLVIDRRSHVGGNCYSEVDDDTGIEVHKYGSHIFHTSNLRVWNYLQQFTQFNNYRHRVLTRHKGRTYTMPINLMTINRFFNVDLSPTEAKKFIEEKVRAERIDRPSNLEEKAISLIGRELYEAFIMGYTQKQWGISPKLLPENIITRLPLRMNYNDFYFSDPYEGIPIDGYTKIFERILSHQNITVELNVDFFGIKDRIPKDCTVIYSGPIDRYFDYRFGRLGWRTTDFEVERLHVDDFQGTSVMNYADLDVKFTRTHEFKHFHPERHYDHGKTVVFKEFSRLARDEDIPYYPINTADDRKMVALYKEAASTEKNVIFGGRLGNYVYVDMHQTIAMALNAFDQLKSKLNRST